MSHAPDLKTARLTRTLRDGGVRVTRQREAVLKVLNAAEDHPDAAELRRRVAPPGCAAGCPAGCRGWTTRCRWPRSIARSRCWNARA